MFSFGLHIAHLCLYTTKGVNCFFLYSTQGRPEPTLGISLTVSRLSFMYASLRLGSTNPNLSYETNYYNGIVYIAYGSICTNN